MINIKRLAKKGGRRGASTTVVTKVVATKRRSTPKMKMAREPRASDQLSRYQAALHSPFSPEAMGCRVPDAFAYPTATFRINGKTSLSSNNTGLINMAFFNNPLVSVIDFVNVTSAFPVSYGPANANVFGFTSAAELSSVMGSFRVVAWGLQVRNVLPTTAAAGLITVVPYPTVGIIPGPRALLAQPFLATSIFTKATGLSLSGSSLPATVLGLPNAVSLTSQDLISDRLTIRGVPTSPSSETFHNAGDFATLGSNLYSLEDGFVSTAGIPTVGGYYDSASTMNLDGWSCFMMQGSGLPVNTACYELEWVIHLEGPPSVLTTSSVLPSAVHVSHVDPTGYVKAIARATAAPLITLATGLASSYGGPVGGAIAGGLGKLLMAKLGLSL